MVRIVSDTASLFTPQSGREAGMDILPLNVTIGGKTYREIEEISSEELLELIKHGDIPTSSQPAPAEIMDVYAKATEREPVLNITMADGLSGTYQTACGVRETMSNKEHITVLNSRTLCGPQEAIVKKALKLAERGLGVEEIVRRLEENISSSKSFLIPQDFDYLRRGGRLSPGASHVGSLLKLTPLLVQSSDGMRLDKAAICRGFERAVEKCIEGFKRIGVDERYRISICHAGTPEQGRQAYSMISDTLHGVALELRELTPAFITQGGPRCVSIQAIIRV